MKMMMMNDPIFGRIFFTFNLPGDDDAGDDHYLIPVVCCTHEPK